MSQWEAYLKFRYGLSQILDERFYPLEWLDAQMWSHAAKLLWNDTSAIIFELKEYPSGLKEVHGLAAVGDMDSIILQLIPMAEQWGREMGCVTASIASRGGWARALKSHGYELFQTSIRKEL